VISASQLFGNATAGQYCFEEEVDFADGTLAVSPLTCTTLDLTGGGESFLAASPQESAIKLLDRIEYDWQFCPYRLDRRIRWVRLVINDNLSGWEQRDSSTCLG
jgi:hypothetical protein